jgi:HEPN domain-containing protein
MRPVDEPLAWLRQSRSDRDLADWIISNRSTLVAGSIHCHAIAKWQQAVEKAVKAIIAALQAANVLHIAIGYGHGVERFMRVLIRLPRSRQLGSIQQHLRVVFDENTRGSSRALEALAPRRPSGEGSPARNTEYPFQLADGSWTFPAEIASFTEDEAQRFRELAYRVVASAEKIVYAIARRPK